jgi:hypothetical protein
MNMSYFQQYNYRPLKFPVSTSVYLYIALVALLLRWWHFYCAGGTFIALVALWENGLPCRIVVFSQSVWVYRNHPLTEEQKENNRMKSKVRCRIEHHFLCKDRALFCTAFPIREQAEKGEEWLFELQAIYFVSGRKGGGKSGGKDRNRPEYEKRGTRSRFDRQNDRLVTGRNRAIGLIVLFRDCIMFHSWFI